MSNINVNNITPLSGNTGTVSVSGSLTVSGSITANGNIILGDASTDSISFGAEVSSSILPDADNTYNLGSSTKEWKDLYVDGTANIDTLAGVNLATVSTASINFVSSSVIPNADNTYDLGSSTKEWKDIYVTGIGRIDQQDNVHSTSHVTASGNISASGNFTGVSASLDHVTTTGNIKSNGSRIDCLSGTVSAEHFYSLDDIEAAGTVQGEHLYSTDDATITDRLTVGTIVNVNTYNVTASVAVSCSGTVTANTISGVSGSVEHLVVNQFVSSSLIPDGYDTSLAATEWNHTTWDLGSSNHQWNDLYIHGTAFIDQISGSGAKGDAALTSSVHIIPDIDNKRDLGATDKEWKDLYVDGTAYIDTVQAGAAGGVGAVNIYSNTTASLYTSASLSEIRFENLPTTQAEAIAQGSGSLWVSGSTGGSQGYAHKSKYLLVYTG